VGPPWLVPFARELVLAGEGARVQDVLERAEEAVMRNERAQHALIDAVRGHLAVSRGDVTGASEWFRAALSIWDEEPSVRAGAALRKGGGFALQRALTALDLATVVNGHPAELWESKDDAIAAARDAGEFFLRCGAVGLREEAARLERALLGGRPAESRTEAAEGAPHGAGGERGAELDEARERAYRRMSVLTSRERQVSLEVVAGKSNREIATDLYLSVRTVEYHLGNCLSKLGISSRGELRRALRPAADHLSMRSPTP
jgi:DNA-binding CsgD family transcriptional regulator